jgi:hypothetical protein
MTIRISELAELSVDVAQSDVLPIVDIGAQETKKIQVGNLLLYGISGMPSGSIDLSLLSQNSTVKLSSTALAVNGVVPGTYGNAATVPQFTVNDKGLVTFASGVAITIAATNVTGLAPVATSGTYASLSGLPTLGTIASQDASSVSISGGTISEVSLTTGSAVISGGTIVNITDLTVADGGTGASNAADARTNLGLIIGSDVQGYSPILSGVTQQFTAADQIVYSTASGALASTTLSSFGRSVISGASADAVRTTIGLGTLATQNATSVAISGGTVSGVSLFTGNAVISGGSIVGISDLAIADGGTGASTAAAARTNLGLDIGNDIQAFNSNLQQISSLYSGPDEIVYASASGVIETTVLSSIGRAIISGQTADEVKSILGIGNIASQSDGSVTISGGVISNVTLSTSNATITGGNISGISDLAIADGGTGASTAADARTNLGVAIGSNVQAYSPILSGVTQQFTAANQTIYSTASGVLASTALSEFGRSVISGGTAATVRTTLGLGSIATQDANSVAISGGTISGVNITATNPTISGGTIVAITDLAIADGGTGASTASGARANLGLAINSDIQGYSPLLANIAQQFTNADEIIYSTASGIVASTPISAVGRSIISGSTEGDARNSLGLGTLSVQNAGSVSISGGTITGISDLAIADGGTGASNAADARANLGLAIGTNVQAYSAGLSSIGALSPASGSVIYSQGNNTYTAKTVTPYMLDMLASGDAAASTRTYLGLGSLATKDTIGNSDIPEATISGAILASGTLTSREIGANAIYTASIQDASVTTAKIVNSGVTAIKLADNSSSIVAIGAPLANGTFIGQRYFDTATSYSYVWDGIEWEREAGITNITFTDSTPLGFSVGYADRFSAQITTTLENQSANTFFAGPSSGVATTPAFRTLTSSDLPIATTSTLGVVTPGAGLAVTAGGTLNHSNTVAAGSYIGAFTIDSQGHITSAATELTEEEIPGLDASKIITGQFSGEFLAPNSVTASQLADYGIAQVSETAPVPEFAGQWWVNPNDRSAYIWVGEVTPLVQGYWLNLGYGSPTQINLRFGGTYNASGNVVESINSYGIEAGLSIGQGLAAPNSSNNGVYLIVTTSGVGVSPAPGEALAVGNWVLSQGNGATWTKVNLSSAVAGIGDQDVLVDGGALSPVASGVASQEDLNEILWGRTQIATTISRGIVQASSEVLVNGTTGTMTIGVIDDGTY